MINFDMSRSPVPRLELTSRNGCGRLCDYCPQSTYIAEYKSLTKFDKDRANTLTYETIKRITPNIPRGTIISHTGFTEPFDNPDFPAIVDHFWRMGFSQTISTTLYGYDENKKYFLRNLPKFNHSITIHLPDAEGLMKGSFDEDYSIYFSDLLNEYERLKEKRLIHDQFFLFLIGDDFNESIKSSALRFESVHQGARVQRAKYLNTRAGVIVPSEFRMKQTPKVRTNGETYHCAYKRLNRGVMLPNGDVTICSQDYGLKGILGSLLKEDLAQIYSRIESDGELRSQFLSGNFSPCNQCEHYSPLGRVSTGNRSD